jgi:hypothetical protein
MSKKDKKVSKKEKKEKVAAPKYGINELAEVVGTSPASCRIHLRKMDIEKSGKSYGWDSKSAMEDVAKQIKNKMAKAEEPAKKSKKKSKK